MLTISLLSTIFERHIRQRAQPSTLRNQDCLKIIFWAVVTAQSFPCYEAWIVYAALKLIGPDTTTLFFSNTDVN